MDSFKSVLASQGIDRHNVANRIDRKSPYYLDKQDGLISPPESDSNSVTSLEEYNVVKPSTAQEVQVNYEGSYKFAPIKVSDIDLGYLSLSDSFHDIPSICRLIVSMVC